MCSSWRARLVIGVVGAGVALGSTGCSSDEVVIPDVPTRTATPTPTTVAPTTAAPVTDPTSTDPTSTDSVGSSLSATPTRVIDPAPTPPTGSAAASTGAKRGLRAARSDARTVGPALVDYYNQREFPVNLQQVRETFDGAGVTLAAANSIGAYSLADNGTDFVLCIQHDGGGWASFDSAAGRVLDLDTTGACPS